MRQRYEVTMPGSQNLAWYPSTGHVKWVQPSGREIDSGLSLPIPEQDVDPGKVPDVFNDFAYALGQLGACVREDMED